MFQFTREFIINDNVGKLTGGVKILTDAKAQTMYIDNMVNIRKKDVHAVYKNPYQAESVDAITVTPTGTTPVASDLYRLTVSLGLVGKTSAPFNDAMPDHTKELVYETTGATSWADVVDGLIKAVVKESKLSDVKFVSITGNSGVISIVGLDCYTVVKGVKLVKLPMSVNAATIGALLTGFEAWDTIVDWSRKDGSTSTVAVVSKAKEGNGNTVQILKNMRLLTDANINPYGLNMDERPVPKGQYDQYTVELVTERRHIGHDVMGSVGTSLTTLIFYVLTSPSCACDGTVAPSDAFEQALADLNLTIESVELTKEGVDKTGTGVTRILAHTSDLPVEEEGSSASSK